MTRIFMCILSLITVTFSVSAQRSTNPDFAINLGNAIQSFNIDKCGNASEILDPGAGYVSYSWSDGSSNPTLTVSTAGTYSVTLSDGTNTFIKIYNISNYPINDPGAGFLGPDITQCFANNSLAVLYQIDAPSGYFNYTWSDGLMMEDRTISINNTTNTTYVLSMEDEYGCYTYTDDIHVEAIASPVITLGGVTPNFTNNSSDEFVANQYINCESDPSSYSSPITLSAPAGYASYQWYNSSNTTDQEIVTQDGDYGVIVTDANGCSGSDYIRIKSAPVTNMTIQQKGEYCGNNTVGLIATYDWNNSIEQTFTYSWTQDGTVISSGTYNNNSTGGANVLETATSGVYEFTLTNQFGCTISVQHTIAAVTPISITTDAVTDVTTYLGVDGTIAVSVIGGTPSYTYNWDNGDITEDITNLAAGTYTLEVTDANGCKASHSETVNEFDCAATGISLQSSANPYPFVIDGGNPNETCTTIDAIASGGSGSFSYTWAPNTDMSEPPYTDASEKVCPSSTTTYTAMIVDDVTNCPASSAITIDVLTLCSTSPKSIEVCVDPTDPCSTACVKLSGSNPSLPGNPTLQDLLDNGASIGPCPGVCKKSSFSSLEEDKAEEVNIVELYPNPVNGNSTISFELADDLANVKLSIYNVLGEEVYVLYNGSVAKGQTYQFNINSSDLNTGTYYYSLSGENHKITKKFIVLN